MQEYATVRHTTSLCGGHTGAFQVAGLCLVYRSSTANASQALRLHNRVYRALPCSTAHVDLRIAHLSMGRRAPDTDEAWLLLSMASSLAGRNGDGEGGRSRAESKAARGSPEKSTMRLAGARRTPRLHQLRKPWLSSSKRTATLCCSLQLGALTARAASLRPIKPPTP